MTDSARAYFDTVFGMAGEPARRAREFAGRVRDDLRSGTESVRTRAEQFRGHSSRTAADLGRLIRAEVDAGLSRVGIATQADLDDLNLRLEHSEEQIRELRVRLAEATASAKPAEPSIGTASAKPAEPSIGTASAKPAEPSIGTARAAGPQAAIDDERDA